MEQAADGRSSLIVSSTVDPYIQDFSVVASFVLSCICTPDVDLARRLTSGERGLATMVAPQELVRNFFDKDYRFQPDDAKLLTEFTEKLIGLPRATFLSVMRAIRTYVNGMHRIADDLELAYTLLVASVESLAQDFKAQRADWSSFDERKRRAVDKALIDASVETSERVKNALLDIEHTGLRRRFKEFSIEHIPPNVFREPIAGVGFRLGKADLAGALGSAYDLRSKHVHELRRLPDELAMGRGYSETAIIERATHLTLQGLARLMRSVILEFVTRQPLLVQEPYPYRLERSGLVQMRLAPMY
jgi:hypothetical protein